MAGQMAATAPVEVRLQSDCRIDGTYVGSFRRFGRWYRAPDRRPTGGTPGDLGKSPLLALEANGLKIPGRQEEVSRT